MKRRQRIYFTSKQKSEIWDRWQRMLTFIFVTRRVRGSVDPMRILTDYSDNIFQKELTWPSILKAPSTR